MIVCYAVADVNGQTTVPTPSRVVALASQPDLLAYNTRCLYATKRPPPYVPHPVDHSCFRPRKDDYKPPTTCHAMTATVACAPTTGP